MPWVEDGYHLLLVVITLAGGNVENSSSALEHREFILNAIEEMVAANTVTLLPRGEKPMVMSPLGMVHIMGTDKLRLLVNMRYVNRHLGRKAFKFKGMKNLANLAERGNHAISYDLMS